MMRENGEEGIDDAKLPAAQRRPVGVTEIRALDELATEHAAGRHIAFNDVNAKLRTWLIPAIAAVAHHMVTLTRSQPCNSFRLGLTLERATERVSAISSAFSTRSDSPAGRGFAPRCGLRCLKCSNCEPYPFRSRLFQQYRRISDRFHPAKKRTFLELTERS